MSIWKKLILSVVVIGIYFSVLRPIRSHSINMINSGIEFTNFETSIQSSTGISIIFEEDDFSKRFLFKTPFGMFFLLSTISLIFINASWKDLGVLCLIQFTFWLVAFFAMLIGKNGNLFFLELMDLVIRYLLPLFSLGYPAFIIIQRKMNVEKELYES